jgi:hypothetical protein
MTARPTPDADGIDARGRPDRRLDRKLASIAGGSYTADDFVLADAKDADMGFGLTAPGAIDEAPAGMLGPGRYRTRRAYLEAMSALVRQGLLDVLLVSASNGEQLVKEDLVDDEVTLAVRANDTTDIWLARGGTYSTLPSRPFRSADLRAIRPLCDLVLYSVTLNNDLERDLATLEAYREFRSEAGALGMRHFLEIFNPNAPAGLRPGQVPAFVNDSIVRLLAGLTADERPLFLKMTYNGAEALDELVEHDPTLVVGILGGVAGTTRDTFELLRRTEVHGGRVALFGRKIQQAESQLALVALMPAVLRGELHPEEAVRAYHDALAEAGIEPRRTLLADVELTDPVLRSE